MASGIVRGAISAVLEKTPSVSPRSEKLKQLGNEVLTKSCAGESEVEYFDKFTDSVVSEIKEFIVQSVSQKYKSNKLKRERLWSRFHSLRCETEGSFQSLWNGLLSQLNIVTNDPLLEQSVYHEVFELWMCEYFTSSSCTTEVALK